MSEWQEDAPTSATPIDDVGRTAFVTAQWRLEESRRPDRLVDDSLAACFLDPSTEQLAARLAAVLPEAPRMIVLRALERLGLVWDLHRPAPTIARNAHVRERG